MASFSIDDQGFATKNEGPNYFEKYGNFDQLTINEYMPGAGIPPHVDSHSPFEEIFVSLSLNSDTVMTFKKDQTNKSLVLKA